MRFFRWIAARLRRHRWKIIGHELLKNDHFNNFVKCDKCGVVIRVRTSRWYSAPTWNCPGHARKESR